MAILVKDRVKELDKYFPIKEKGYFKSEKIATGLEIEILYKESNKVSLLIAPGDMTPAWGYRDLANELFAQGINTFSLNYFNYGNSDQIAPNKISLQTYVGNLVDAKSWIEQEYNIDNIILFGHSRGSEVVQKYLESADRQEKIVLSQPYFGMELYPYPLTIELASKTIKNIFKKSFKYPREYQNNRFFNNTTFSPEKINFFYDNSVPNPTKLLIFHKISVKYKKYQQPHQILIISANEDRCIPQKYQKKCFEKIKTLENIKEPIFKNIAGNHFACIEDPITTVSLINNFLHK